VLLFWHGNNWAAKICYFGLLIISKTSVFGLSNVFYNTCTGFAGTNFVTDSLFAVFSINVTWYGFYNWFEQLVSFQRYKNREQDMKFKMSHHYAWIRDFTVKNWMYNFAVWMVLAYYSANVCFMVPFYAYGATPTGNGKQVDMWTVGLMIYLLCVWFTHLLFARYFRDFNRTVLIIGAIIWIQWLIVIFLVNMGAKFDPLWKAVWESMFQLQFWSVFFVTLMLMLLPTYIYRLTQSLIVFKQFNYA